MEVNAETPVSFVETQRWGKSKEPSASDLIKKRTRSSSSSSLRGRKPSLSSDGTIDNRRPPSQSRVRRSPSNKPSSSRSISTSPLKVTGSEGRLASPKGRRVKQPPPAGSRSRIDQNGRGRGSADDTTSSKAVVSPSAKQADPHDDIFGEPGSANSLIDGYVEDEPRSSSVSSIASRRSPAEASSRATSPSMSRARGGNRSAPPGGGRAPRRHSSGGRGLADLHKGKGISLDDPRFQQQDASALASTKSPRSTQGRRIASMDSVAEEPSGDAPPPGLASPSSSSISSPYTAFSAAGLAAVSRLKTVAHPTPDQQYTFRPATSTHFASTLTPPRARAEPRTPRGSVTSQKLKRHGSGKMAPNREIGSSGTARPLLPQRTSSGIRFASPTSPDRAGRTSPSPSRKSRRRPPPKKSKSSNSLLQLMPQHKSRFMNFGTSHHHSSKGGSESSSSSKKKKKPASPRLNLAARAHQTVMSFAKSNRGAAAVTEGPQAAPHGRPHFSGRLDSSRSSWSSSRQGTPTTTKSRTGSIDSNAGSSFGSRLRLLPMSGRKTAASRSASRSPNPEQHRLAPGVMEWLKNLQLSKKVRHPTEDLADGSVVAEILQAQYGDSPDAKIPALRDLNSKDDTVAARRENWRLVRAGLDDVGHGSVVSDKEVELLARKDKTQDTAVRVLDRIFARFNTGGTEAESAATTTTEVASSEGEGSRSGDGKAADHDLAFLGVPVDDPPDTPSSGSSPLTPPSAGVMENKLSSILKPDMMEQTDFKQRNELKKELFRTCSSRIPNLRQLQTPRSKTNLKRRASLSDRSTVMRRFSQLVTEEHVQCIALDDLIYGDLVGRGRFSSVFECSWNIRQRDGVPKFRRVAAKEFVYNDDDEGLVPLILLELFQHELDICRQVRHPNVVKLLGMVYEPRPVIVLEFVDQGSLMTTLQNRQQWESLALLEKYHLMHDAAQGLEYLHSTGVLHRDIKSHNILLTRNQEGRLLAKIGDLGSAMFLTPGQKVYEEIGTSGWTAPEVYSGEGYSFPADVWSFGVLMWEMMTPTPENDFVGVTSEVYLERMQKGERWVLPDKMEKSLRSAVISCWDLSPEARPPISSLAFNVNILITGGKTRPSVEPGTAMPLTSTAPPPRGGDLTPPTAL